MAEPVHVTQHVLRYWSHRPVITFVGIRHGQLLPATRPTQTAVHQVLRQIKGPILAEGVNRKFAITPEFANRTWSAAHIHGAGLPVAAWIRRNPGRAIPTLLVGFSILASMDAIRYAAEWTQKPTLSKQQRPPTNHHIGSMMKDLAGPGYSLKEVRDAQGTFTTLRNFLMAARALDFAADNHQIAIIAGAGHASQIQRFVENPHLFRRYGQHAARAINAHALKLARLKTKTRRLEKEIKAYRELHKHITYALTTMPETAIH